MGKVIDVPLEKTHVLVVKVVDSQNKPMKDVHVKVSRLEKEPITLKQWSENLKNGAPLKRLMLSINSNNDGKVTVDLIEGFYEVEFDKFGLRKDCELTHDESMLFIEPKKHWWH